MIWHPASRLIKRNVKMDYASQSSICQVKCATGPKWQKWKIKEVGNKKFLHQRDSICFVFFKRSVFTTDFQLSFGAKRLSLQRFRHEYKFEYLSTAKNDYMLWHFKFSLETHYHSSCNARTRICPTFLLITRRLDLAGLERGNVHAVPSFVYTVEWRLENVRRALLIFRL